MERGYTFNNSQTQAKAFNLIAAQFFKTVKGVLYLGGFHTNAGIGYLQGVNIVAHIVGYNYMAFALIIFYRVINDIK